MRFKTDFEQKHENVVKQKKTLDLSFIKNSHVKRVWSSMKVTNYLAFQLVATLDGPQTSLLIRAKVLEGTFGVER